MRLIVIALLSLILAACAAPDRPRPVPEEPVSPPPSPAERADPVEPVPVIEASPQPEPEPEALPEPETLPEPQPEPQPAERGLPEPEPEATDEAEQRPEPAVPEVAAPAPERREVEAAPVAAALNLSGRVTIFRNGREQPFAGLHLNQTVVAWRPQSLSAVAAMDQQQIVTRQSRFFPQTMAVTSGTEIRFPNHDTIQHNVFSLTPGHQFDIGLYGEGEGRSQIFTGSGMVELYCNVHPNMAAFLLVLDTPHFVNPDEDGRFTLRSLPPGPGELLVWNYRAEELFQRLPMTLSPVTEPVDISLDITRPAVPQHTNKHGEPFGRDRGRP
jgi:plastocyanin